MSSWYEFNVFQRLIFILGFIALVLIIAIVMGFVVYVCEEICCKLWHKWQVWQRMKAKQREQEPVRMPVKVLPKAVRYDWKDRIY